MEEDDGRLVIVGPGLHGKPIKFKRSARGAWEDADGKVDESVDINEKLAEMVARMKDGVRLNCGSRLTPIEGYINIDTTRVSDIVYTCGIMPYFSDSIVDEVRALNCFQHFYRCDISLVLSEWHRVLKPGGFLQIEMPDIRELSKVMSTATDHEIFDSQGPLIWGVDGSQVEWDPVGDTNRNSFTRTYMIRWLERIGFGRIEDVEPEQSRRHRPFALKAYKKILVTP